MTPRQTIESFFQAWQSQEWQICLAYIQISWKDKMGNPDRTISQKVKDFLAGKDYSDKPLHMLHRKLDNWSVARIDSIEIVKAPNMNPAVIKDALIKIKTQKGRLVTLRLRLIKELGPYKPSSDGIWGINPASMHEVQ